MTRKYRKPTGTTWMEILVRVVSDAVAHVQGKHPACPSSSASSGTRCARWCSRTPTRS